MYTICINSYIFLKYTYTIYVRILNDSIVHLYTVCIYIYKHPRCVLGIIYQNLSISLVFKNVFAVFLPLIVHDA